MIGEFLAADVEGIEGIGAVGAVFEQVFLGLGEFFAGFVLAEAVATVGDYRCFVSRKDDAAVNLISGTFATPQEIGRELHRISKTYRGTEHKAVGSYMGLPMSVRSEFNIADMFERNIFFIEGAS